MGERRCRDQEVGCWVRELSTVRGEWSCHREKTEEAQVVVQEGKEASPPCLDHGVFESRGSWGLVLEGGSFWRGVRVEGDAEGGLRGECLGRKCGGL